MPKFSRSQRAPLPPYICGCLVAPLMENKVSVFAQELVLRHSGLSSQRWKPEQKGDLAGLVAAGLRQPHVPHPSRTPSHGRTASTGFHFINLHLNSSVSPMCLTYPFSFFLTPFLPLW